MYRGIDLSDAALCNVSEEVAKEYIDSRVLMKKPLTQRSFKRAMTAAMKCELHHGIPADEAVELTIDKGWQGIVVEYVTNEKRKRQEATNHETGRRNGTGNSRPLTKAEQIDRDIDNDFGPALR